MDTKENDDEQVLANRVIDALGGTKPAAILCDTSESAVSQWRVNGIPSSRLMYIKAVRPDLFGRPRQVARRATDPEPPPGRAGRKPPSAKNVMEMGSEKPPLFAKKSKPGFP